MQEAEAEGLGEGDKPLFFTLSPALSLKGEGEIRVLRHPPKKGEESLPWRREVWRDECLGDGANKRVLSRSPSVRYLEAQPWLKRQTPRRGSASVANADDDIDAGDLDAGFQRGQAGDDKVARFDVPQLAGVDVVEMVMG